MSIVIDGQPVKSVFTNTDPAARPFQNVAALVQTLRKTHPGGVNYILIGLSQASLFKPAPSQKGIIAILIGLLLPAIQKVQASRYGDTALLESALAPGGSLGFVMCDGSVREAKPGGKRLIDCEGYAY